MNNYEPINWKGEDLDISKSIVNIDQYYSGNIEDFKYSYVDMSILVRGLLEFKDGFCILSGLDKWCKSEYDYREIALEFSKFIGMTVSQNLDGDHLVLVQNTGCNTKNPKHRGHKTKDALGFHNDRCDLILLLCVNQSLKGGDSTLVSSKYVHDTIREERPDLLKILYQKFPNHRRGEENLGEEKWCLLPVFANIKGKLICRYVKRFIYDSQIFESAPRLSKNQIEAIEFMDSVINKQENYIKFKLREGQMLLINNHVLLHGRSNYTDSSIKKRTLIRIWLSHEGSRELPKSFSTLYKNIEASSYRGGI